MQAVLLPARRRLLPVFTLAFLAPVIAEFLFGSTHFSTLYLLIVQMGGYGGAAVLIREFVRRQGKGWLTILVLGIAFSIFEECVLLQSSLYPLFVLDINHIYDRVLDINWFYLLSMLRYESVWAIVIPIQLTEMLFPALRAERWLGTRGLIITAIIFLLASVVAWYSWTHRAVPMFYPHLSYQTPWLTIALALLLIVLLVGLALGPWLPVLTIRKTLRLAPWPWLVGGSAFLLSAPCVVRADLIPRRHFSHSAGGYPIHRWCYLVSGFPGAYLVLVDVPQLAGTASRIVLLTTFDIQEYVFEGIRAGAVGYLLKDAETPVLLEGIRAAMEGGVILRSRLSGAALSRALSEQSAEVAPGFPALLEPLTE